MNYIKKFTERYAEDKEIKQRISQQWVSKHVSNTIIVGGPHLKGILNGKQIHVIWPRLVKIMWQTQLGLGNFLWWTSDNVLGHTDRTVVPKSGDAIYFFNHIKTVKISLYCIHFAAVV